MTYGKVDDANGNEILTPLEGDTYTRAKASAADEGPLQQPRIADHRCLALQKVFDLGEDVSHSYSELSIQHDLASKALQLTLTFRKGRKEPAFTAKDEILFGLGVHFPP